MGARQTTDATATYKQEIVDALAGGPVDQDDLVNSIAAAHRDEALYAIGRLGRRDVLDFSYPDVALADAAVEPNDVYEQEVLDAFADDAEPTMLAVLDGVEANARRSTYTTLRTLMENGEISYTLDWNLMLEDAADGGPDG